MDLMNKPLISVIMGVYNCASTLQEAVFCIQKQTYSNWELIMCDDASTDNTYDVACDLATKDDRIIVLKNDNNLSLAPTLNKCLSVARGKYIARMDGDDVCAIDRFDRELDFLENNQDFVLVSCFILLITEASIQITWYAALFPLLILELGILGMGVGIIISSLTVKYRDLQVLVSFGVQLWMYISPVVYSVSSIENTTLKTIVMLNPVSPVIEFMRAGWLGVGSTEWLYLAISLAVTMVIAFLGLVIFNKTEKNFMDKI